MSGGGGEAASPGMYRKQAVRVGNLVPPPAPLIAELIADLEIYINTDTQTPPLIRAGLVHVHFEMIHPFLDGNGRVGRLLILLMLLDAGVITAPIVYPSFYFKKHHQEYYQRLDAVRTQGDFEGWITYYLKAVKESAQDACARAKQIQTLEADLKNQWYYLLQRVGHSSHT
jgi:Fic family protein